MPLKQQVFETIELTAAQIAENKILADNKKYVEEQAALIKLL